MQKTWIVLVLCSLVWIIARCQQLDFSDLTIEESSPLQLVEQVDNPAQPNPVSESLADRPVSNGDVAIFPSP